MDAMDSVTHCHASYALLCLLHCSKHSGEVLVRINKQSPDIAGGVHVGKATHGEGISVAFNFTIFITAACAVICHLSRMRWT